MRPKLRKILIGVLQGLGLLLLFGYIGVAAAYTAVHDGEQPCTGIQIEVNDSAKRLFVTAAQVAAELGDLPARVKTMPIRDVDTDSMERLLTAIDKIEDATAVCLTDGRVYITVQPLEPVARVFPVDGSPSYYINRAGKTMTADPQYHMDVPVIHGSFSDSSFTARDVLPLLDWLADHPGWDALTGSVKADSPRDILLLPIVRGHVVNLGDLRDLDSKFARLDAFYRKVLPVRGYETYDTISVKWGGQVVATLRERPLPKPTYVTDDDEPDADDIETMTGSAPVPVTDIYPNRKKTGN